MQTEYDVAAFVNKHVGDYRIVSGGREIIINCPWHDDHKKHLSVNSRTGLFMCFVCGEKGGFRKLVNQITDRDNPYEYRVGDIKEEAEEEVESSDWPPPNFFPLEYPDLTRSAVRARAYLHSDKRKLTDDQIIYYGIGYCIGGRYDRRVVVPVTNMKGVPVSFIARDYTDQQKLKVLTPQSKPGHHGVKDYVFNLHVARYRKRLVITEGVFSAIAVGLDGVAIFGKKPTAHQLCQLLTVKPKQVIICLDSDAQVEAEFLARKFLMLCKDVRIAYLQGGDPNELDSDVLKEYLVTSVPVETNVDPLVGVVC